MLNTLDELDSDGDSEKRRHRANHGDAWRDRTWSYKIEELQSLTSGDKYIISTC
jgi:hypothetical protein